MNADFLDSNVLVYLFDDRSAAKQGRAETLVRTALDKRSGVISSQVVQETLNVLTRKLRPPVQPAQAQRLLDSLLMPLCRVWPSEALYRQALGLQARWQLSFYDALIVAAALEAGCTRLLSEDLQDGQQIESLRVENPFSGL
jgi:predicted nucleic acid-binding protein